jgi:CMP-N,N'-diacetyllegionaminic acid synthase
MKKVAALIPARAGSKGVPHKNIRELCGYPLIAYSIAACKFCEEIDDIFISTDDKEIANIAEKYGAKVPFLRPKKYAKDNSTDYEYLQHFFSNVAVEEIALIRPTTPLRNPVILNSCIKKYHMVRDQVTGMRSMHELAESPYKYFKINDEGFCEGLFKDYDGIKNYTNLPRQIFPKAYHPNGYVDIIKKKTIIGGSTYGDKIYPLITDFVTEVDTLQELKIIENELKISGNLLIDLLQCKYEELVVA